MVQYKWITLTNTTLRHHDGVYMEQNPDYYARDF